LKRKNYVIRDSFSATQYFAQKVQMSRDGESLTILFRPDDNRSPQVGFVLANRTPLVMLWDDNGTDCAFCFELVDGKWNIWTEETSEETCNNTAEPERLSLSGTSI